MLPLTVGFVDQMLNFSKNGIKLLNTHSVVGIEPVQILSQIFIQSVKVTKILICLIYRVYPIHLIVFFPSKKKQCSCCLFPIHYHNGIYIEHFNKFMMLQQCC